MHTPIRDLKALFSELLETAFSLTTLARGRRYHRQGRAQLHELTPQQSKEHMAIRAAGTCMGSEAQEYVLKLTLHLDFSRARLSLHSHSCTCPVGGYCKHTVALLLLIEEAFVSNPSVAVMSQHKTTPIRQTTLDWLATFESPFPLPEEPTSERVLYLLEENSLHEFSISTCKARLLKNGGFGKLSHFQANAAELSGQNRRSFIDPDDILPLSLISAQLSFRVLHSNYRLHSAQSGLRLHDEVGALILMLCAQTGRLYYRHGIALTPLALGDELPITLTWAKNKKGQQWPSIQRPPESRVIRLWPFYLVDLNKKNIHQLHSEWDRTELNALLDVPELTTEEAVLVHSRLTAKARHFSKKEPVLPLPELKSNLIKAPPPTTVLYLTRAQFCQFELGFYSGIPVEYPIAELRFEYKNNIHFQACTHPLLLTFEHDQKTWIRDTAHEQAMIKQVERVGLLPSSTVLPSYVRPLEHDPDAENALCFLPLPPDATHWLRALEKALPQLEEKGIVIEYDADFPFEVAMADDWFVDVKPETSSATSDWFDLDLGVIIDGQTTSLIPPLIALIKENPLILHHLETLDDDEKHPVRLDGRRVLPIPVPRLRAWLKPLLEFLDDERPRLSRYHAATLAELDEMPSQWLGGEALLELGRRLRQFSGITETLPSPAFQAQLRPYQQLGLNWLQFLRSYGLAGILADDMGLGKTVQTLAHLHLEKHEGRADRPSLVVAPTSLLPNWAAEARQFAPELRVLTLHGIDRSQYFDKRHEADLILTTYPLLVRDQAILLNMDYHFLVLDEAQFIKNPKAQSHKVARQIKARHRLSLTGTPLENHLGELWAQFDFLMPGFLGAQKRFSKVFRTPIEKQNDLTVHRQLSARVAPFLLRRTKEAVLSELPACTEIIRWVELTGAQRDLYESLRVAFDAKLRELLAVQGIGQSQIMILDALLKLRQACCDPRLVKLSSAQQLGVEGIKASAKLQELVTLVEELLQEGRRILLFSQFTSMLGLIEIEFKEKGWEFAKLTGQTRDRETPVRRFQAGEVPIFIISLKAGGTGLNLTAADTVIHYDPWWNPAVEAQATARAHRIGQDKPVFVYKLLGKGTVEEKILSLQSRKRGLSEQLLSGRQKDEQGHLITADDLDVLFTPID